MLMAISQAVKTKVASLSGVHSVWVWIADNPMLSRSHERILDIAL